MKQRRGCGLIFAGDLGLREHSVGALPLGRRHGAVDQRVADLGEEVGEELRHDPRGGGACDIWHATSHM